MFTVALFTIAKIRKQPKCPSTDEWIKKMWYIYTQCNSSQSVKSFCHLQQHGWTWGLPWRLSSEESACNAETAGDMSLIPGSERFPGRGHGHPLQYSILENPMDRGAWWATVHGVPKSQTGTTYDQDKWQRRCPNSGFLLTRDW